MKEQKGYITRNGIVIGQRPLQSKGFKKFGFSDFPLDIHIIATEEQLKNGRRTITVSRIINNELYETVIPNAKLEEIPIQFIDDWDDEPLDFIDEQEEIIMQRARENAVDSIRKSRRNRTADTKNNVNLCLV